MDWNFLKQGFSTLEKRIDEVLVFDKSPPKQPPAPNPIQQTHQQFIRVIVNDIVDSVARDKDVLFQKEKEIEQLRAEAERLSKQEVKLTQTLKQKVLSLREKDKITVGLETKVKEIQERNALLEAEVGKWKLLWADIEKEVKEGKDAVVRENAAGERVKELESVVIELKDALKKAKKVDSTEVKQLQEKLDVMQKEAEKNQQESAEKITNLQKEAIQATQKYREREDGLMNELIDTRQRLSKEARENTSESNQISAQQMSAATQQNNVLQRKLDETEKQLAVNDAEREKEKQDFVSTIHSLEKQSDDSKKEILQYKNQILDCQERLHEAKLSAENFKKELAINKKHLNQIRSEMAQLETINAKQIQELSTQLELQKTSTFTEINRLNQQLNDKNIATERKLSILSIPSSPHSLSPTSTDLPALMEPQELRDRLVQLQRQHHICLQLLGEKTERVKELEEDLNDLKILYRQHLQKLY